MPALQTGAAAAGGAVLAGEATPTGSVTGRQGQPGVGGRGCRGDRGQLQTGVGEAWQVSAFLS